MFFLRAIQLANLRGFCFLLDAMKASVIIVPTSCNEGRKYMLARLFCFVTCHLRKYRLDEDMSVINGKPLSIEIFL